MAPRLKKLSHLDRRGQARMKDVGGKPVTRREAVASARVKMQPATVRALKTNALAKGDALAVARVAGILAAKRTAELIPLCHPLPLDQVAVDFAFGRSEVRITARASVSARTGVEMEALTAAAVAALAIYDMAKAIDRGMVITDLQLEQKSGGRSGAWRRSLKSGRAAGRPSEAVSPG
jgi:cyclic pyranopterin phosphate synthase